MFTEEEIRKEYDRLDKILGIDTSHIIIDFGSSNKTETAAFTQFYSNAPTVPKRIRFNMAIMGVLNDTNCLDIIRHEYAHAAVALKENYTGLPHGGPWKKICRQIGCRPSPYTYNGRKIEYIEDYKIKEKMVRVKCCNCGRITMQPDNSRIVKILRNGGNSWNLKCKKCGRMVFTLPDK